MTPHHHHTVQDEHGHGHEHGPGHAPVEWDWDALGAHLEQEAEIQRPVYTSAAAWITELLPAAGVRRVLDIGSGPGVVSVLLAEAFPTAEIVAVDGAQALLERAADRAGKAGVGDRFRTRLAELPADLGGLGEADIVWAGNSLHHIGDQRAALEGFAALLRPGGVVALVEGGLTNRHLPRDLGSGRPGLEARLDAHQADRFARMRSELPGAERETEDWPALLTAAGLEPSGTRSFLLDVPAPVSPAVRELITRTFTRMRDFVRDGLAADDGETLDRLVDPADPESLARRPDLFLLGARTVHTARKVQAPS